MPFDLHANLAISAVAVAPAPTLTGTELFVQPGHGVRFPLPPFNATVWDVMGFPSPETAEVVRVTAVVGDQLTIERAAEPGAPARDIRLGDLIAETITAKALQDIESGVNFPLITTPGPVTSGAGFFTGGTSLVGDELVFPVDGIVRTDTPGGADNGSLSLWASGGGVPSRGATLTLLGSQNGATDAGAAILQAGDVATGRIKFSLGNTVRGVMHQSGGFSWGSETDPGAGNLSVAGNVHVGGAAILFTGFLNPFIGSERLDGSVSLAGGQAPSPGLGGYFAAYGNNASVAAGKVIISAGDVAPGTISFLLGNDERGTMHRSGGFSWGSLTDPGSDNLRIKGELQLGPGVEQKILIPNADGADTGSVWLAGGGDYLSSRGAVIGCIGNEGAAGAGELQLYAGNVPTGTVSFYTGADLQRGVMHPSGGFSWGSAVDPGAGNLSVTGSILADAGKRVLSVTGGFPGGITAYLRADGIFAVPSGSGGGGTTPSAHASTHCDGGSDPIVGNISPNRVTVGENLVFAAGGARLDHSLGLTFATGATSRGAMFASGGFSWGDVTDPGATNMRVAGSFTTSVINAYGVIASYKAGEFLSQIASGSAAWMRIFNEFAAGKFGMEYTAGGQVATGAPAHATVVTSVNSSLVLGSNGAMRMQLHPSGGVSVGATGDHPAGDFYVTGRVTVIQGVNATNFQARGGYNLYTNDAAGIGSAPAYMVLGNAGGSVTVGIDNAEGTAYGSGLAYGATFAGQRLVLRATAAGATGGISFYSDSGSIKRFQIHPSGGVCVGPAVDPGNGILFIGAINGSPGYGWVQITPVGAVQISSPGTGANNHETFYNAAGVIGAIQCSGSATAYLTTSDQGLKRDLGCHTDMSVLEQLVIHRFQWLVDGRDGRGVFAQEAARVAPFATAQVEGRWMVDYSKLVPDLIAGWQRHEARIAALEAQLRERN